MNRTKDELLLECIKQFEHIGDVLGYNRLSTTRSLINEINQALAIPDVSGSYDNDWDDAFYKVEEGLKNKPIHYKDSHNLRGEVFLKELYENYGIDFEDGIDELVDLVAYLISEGGYKIIKK